VKEREQADWRSYCLHLGNSWNSIVDLIQALLRSSELANDRGCVV
jgi:hypothetical protein